MLNATTRTEGSRYQATRHLRATEVAKLIRADIAAAIKAGEIPAIKASVRCSGSSMHDSIGLVVTAVPAGFQVKAESEQANRDAGQRCPWLTAEASALLARLDAMREAYNYDASQIEVDHFDTRFYGSVAFSFELRHGAAARAA